MDTVVTSGDRFEPVGFGGAVARQLGLLWSSRRPVLLLVGLVGIMALAGDPWAHSPLARFLAVWPIWVILVGPMWAFAVFHNEGPGARMYLWSHPVARDTHTLARVAAGLAWLWLLYGVVAAAGLLIAAMDGEIWQLAELSPAGWVNYFTGPLLGYLAVSALTVASDYPLRWFFGLLFLVPLLISLLADLLELDALVRTLLVPLTDDAWGLGITMVGAFGGSVERIQDALSDGGVGSAGDPFVAPGTWWVATPLWVLFFLGVVWLLARRHPDTLPRLWRRG